MVSLGWVGTDGLASLAGRAVTMSLPGCPFSLAFGRIFVFARDEFDLQLAEIFRVSLLYLAHLSLNSM